MLGPLSAPIVSDEISSKPANEYKSPLSSQPGFGNFRKKYKNVLKNKNKEAF
jgi:hypothetical protein